MNEIEKMIKTVGGSIEEYREIEKMVNEVKEHKTVEITEGALENMISYMREYIFELTGDEHSDSATHPSAIPFLDYLISVRAKHLKKENNNG